MLVAGALTLAVPLVGWQSVEHLYNALQQTRIDAQTLKVANMRLSLAEVQSINQLLTDAQITSGENDWFAPQSPFPMFVDGYADDWQELPGAPVSYSLAEPMTDSDEDLQLSVRSAHRDGFLYLFVRVVDDQVLYHSPPLLRADAGEGELPDRESLLVNGDSLELLVRNEQKVWQHGLFRAIAPGTMIALQASAFAPDSRSDVLVGRPMPDWEGFWVTETNGYHLELKVPLPPSGSVVSLAIVDMDMPGEARASWAGIASPASMKTIVETNKPAETVKAGLLFYGSPLADTYLQRWTSLGTRVRLFDSHGRPVADVNRLYADAADNGESESLAHSSDGLWDALLLRLFAFFLAGDLPLLPENRQPDVNPSLSQERRSAIVQDTPLTSRYVTDENDRVLGTLAPIGSDPRRGYLLVEGNEEHASAYAGSELARLFSLLLAVSLLAGSGLLIFAFVLSSRIRHLSTEAQQAITDDGRVRGLPDSDARDEIGDLSRKLTVLLSRSASYTQYLEALASRLSHELKTPLSVVRTSIENLDRAALDEQSLVLVDRASDGAAHLGQIIKALVESTRLEQSVQLAEHQRIELSEWLSGCKARYEQVYPEAVCRLHPAPLPMAALNASPELLQQAFDKLVDNALGFSTGGAIVLYLKLDRKNTPATVTLGVANQGPAIEPGTLSHWFDPLFSERTAQHDGLHLGLGLYIVKMIAEAHGGKAFAQAHQSRDGKHWIHVGMQFTQE